MRSPDFIVLTPPGTPDPGVAIAACRAGALGVLDLEHARDPADAGAAIARLRRFTKAEFAVKLGSGCEAVASAVLHESFARPTWVLLAGGDHSELQQWIADFRHHKTHILFEATSLAEALLGERLGVDGLVLKGHEAGGRVGSDTSFILLQDCMDRVKVPLWIQGGIGLHTVAACKAAGAAGAVLDSQVLLARESPLDQTARNRLTAYDGSQTICLGERLDDVVRAYYAPGLSAIEELRRLEEQILASGDSRDDRRRAWREAVTGRVGPGGDDGLWLLGQDAAMARSLAERYGTVGGIIRALDESAAQHVEAARRLRPLAAGSCLAKRHGTRYPIVQGPMTRVSDTPAFAEAVARAGALPFLALAFMRRAETEKLLAETSARLADRPWGVGILGFGLPEIRREQLEAVCNHHPPFALIAGGRPDQARQFEQEGIPTYLHVPSAELLRRFLGEGARRFVFEGRECGGHVGPRTSFVLWDAMCEVLLEHVAKTGRGDDLHVLFAGGIHDGRSAAMVAALAGRLAERDAAIGVLMGSAYVFTKEAVETGAIVSRFQQEALRGRSTVLLASGPGHETRCLNSPYTELYRQEKESRVQRGESRDQIREALERMNVGRLRIAAKGIDRNPESPESRVESHESRVESPESGVETEEFVSVPEGQQYARGMYMIGQVAALRGEITTMDELHEEVCRESGESRVDSRESGVVEGTRAEAADIAIIGMGCFFPQAGSLRSYWQNIIGRHDAITEVPLDHWDWRLYFESEGKGQGKINSKWGGFLDDVPFDPLRYGMPPNSLTSIEPLQLLLLEAVRQALADAGYAQRPFDRQRTAVILGAGGGAAQLSMAYAFQAYLPLLDTVPGLQGTAAEILEKCAPLLPEWTEDTFPGILLNVAAGRVANRFDFGGSCFSVDAACGSSLAALYLGTRELQTGASDVAVVMGGDTVQNPFTYMLFSTTSTFSPRGRCRPFDQSADGIVISEGIGVVVLKRLADAQRDGDRIYAVIKGVGASSDGKDRGLTAPRPEGQMRALRRAYANAGVSPTRVGLIEAHGTGTVVGDRSEVESAAKVFAEAGARPRSCALGSVKSLIGHTKCAAGLAGLINATLALYHKVRPPILVDQPNPKANFAESPFFLNTEPRPWIHGAEEPRCAGVSAFGFGGTNFHAVLEEYTGDFLPVHTSALPSWPAELLVWRRPDRGALIEAVEQSRQAMTKGAQGELADLAASLADTATSDTVALEIGQPVLAIVASSLDELKQKTDTALKILRSDKTAEDDPRGIYFSQSPKQQPGKVAFLFPGQGSQYPDMLAQLAMAFSEVRESFDRAEGVLSRFSGDGRLPQPLGSLVFPPSPFSAEDERSAARALMQSDVAQPAVAAASLGMFRLFENLGVRPDLLAGHSYGDFVALCAAGVIGEEDLIRISQRRGQAIMAAAGPQNVPGTAGGMVAVDAPPERCEELLADIDGVTVANLNAPQQIVISGTDAGLEMAMRELAARGIRCRRIDVSCPFHSPFVAAAREPLSAALAECKINSPTRPVYSNTTAAPFPDDPEAITGLLLEHLTSPVRFLAEIEAMYEAGARIFLEIGPQEVITGLVGRILGDRPHLAVASNRRSRPDLVQLLHVLGRLLAHGVEIRLQHLFACRDLLRVPLSSPAAESAHHPASSSSYSSSTWLINSVRVRPWQDAEPVILGQPRPVIEKLYTGGKDSLTTPTKPTTPTPSAIPMPDIAVDRSAGMSPTDIDGASRVVLRFQEMMSQFLQTQRSVMEGYLQGSPQPLSNWDRKSPESRVQSPESSAKRDQPGSRLSTLGSGPSTLGSGLSTLDSRLSTLGSGSSTRPRAADSADERLETDAKPTGTDRQALTDQLLEAVSKRTGYPIEMLDLDLNLEADLGIDSIKRVEILSLPWVAQILTPPNGRVASGGNGDASAGIEMEKLTSFKSLRDIIDYLMEAGETPDAGEKPDAGAKPDAEQVDTVRWPTVSSATPSPQPDGIHRMLVRPVSIAAPPDHRPDIFPGTLLVTDDERGVAAELIGRLRALGQQVALVSMPFQSEGPHKAGDREVAVGDATHKRFAADLTDPAAVEELLKRVRQHVGQVSGIIHLLPLAEPLADESWNARMRREVKSLFLLARGLASDIGQHGDGQGLLLAATGMGGSFGAAGAVLPESFFPGHGGVAGLVKSLAHEWPEALVRVLDLDPREPCEDVAARLLAELGDADAPVEIGYVRSQRITLQCTPAPVDALDSRLSTLDSQSTVLITGGARGITAAVALELARRYGPRLVLVGWSPLPAELEPEETARLTKPGELKAALLNQLRHGSGSVSPAEVEQSYRRLLRDREVRTNLASLRETGAEVHYYQADVRDENAVEAVIQEIHQRFGGCDGVIHGAGVIDDKLIGDKTPESFDHVFGTKLEGALNLSRLLDPDKLKFCVFFGSVAGRFGNRGQSDYAAANEVLSKLATYLDRRWPGRVVSIVWGPWSRIGMVAELEEHLSQRGLQLIPPEIGALRFDEELQYGRKGECEVVIAGEVGQLDRPHHAVGGTCKACPAQPSVGHGDAPPNGRAGAEDAMQYAESFDGP